MFWCSNILYVWIDDIAANLFKFSAGVQQNALDCKMLHSGSVQLFVLQIRHLYGVMMKKVWTDYAQIYYCIMFTLLECVFATYCIHSSDRLLENGT